MKRVLAMVCILLVLVCSFACGSDKVIDGKKYTTYGLVNRDEARDPNIEYSLILGNCVWGIILCETVVAPVYFFGFSVYEPVGKKGAAD